MRSLNVSDGAERFEVTLLAAPGAARSVLFAVGGGGDPRRHQPLLESLAAHGCNVIAPHAVRLQSPRPTPDELLQRARRLRLALEVAAPAELPVVGVGHSIGAAILLGLAGAQLWLSANGPLPLECVARLNRLALLAPATDFFRPPGALAAVRIPIGVWAGALDTITPPAQARFLAEALGPDQLELHVDEEAAHFSFMHTPPPQWIDTMCDREAFLARLSAQVCGFVAR